MLLLYSLQKLLWFRKVSADNWQLTLQYIEQSPMSCHLLGEVLKQLFSHQHLYKTTAGAFFYICNMGMSHMHA